MTTSGHIDPDGWRWADPRWRDRVDQTSMLALVVEALRRSVDLRDTLADAGSDATARALFLTDVLNTMYGIAVAERSGGAHDVPHGNVAEIVEALYDSGLLTTREYRSTL